MRLERSLFRSKVARRMLVLFVACAMLPTAALAVLAFRSVSAQLYEQSETRLHQTSKSIGMAIVERLVFLETEAKLVLKQLVSAEGGALRKPPAEMVERLRERFRAMVFVPRKGGQAPVFGRIDDLPSLARADREALASGRSVIATVHHPDRAARVFLIAAEEPLDPDRGILVAEIELSTLVGMASNYASGAAHAFWILNERNEVILGSDPGRSLIPDDLGLRMRHPISGGFEWSRGRERYQARYWSIFLESQFAAPTWTVLLAESRSEVLAPMTRFARTFPLIVVAALGFVLLLSIRQIRRSLVPLERLHEATRRIALRDFETRVSVDSGDEFEALARAFNEMTGRLGQQFKALATIHEIDRAILSSMDTDSIVEAVLRRIRDVYPCDAASVMLLGSAPSEIARNHLASAATDWEVWVEQVRPRPEDVETLLANPEGVSFTAGDALPGYLAPLAECGVRSLHVLPIVLADRLAAIIAVGHASGSVPESADLVFARQLADQVAVALSNARMLEEVRFLAYHDSLTGLPNRVALTARVDEALAGARPSGRHVALLLIGLDDFKRVNDTLGHSRGDELLKAAAERISGVLCETDTLARISGDEFTIALMDLPDSHEVESVAERVLAALVPPFSIDSHEVFLTASVGIAAYPSDGTDLESLLKNADTAMHHAKDLGRSRLQFYTRSMNETALERLQLEGQLRRALECHEFVLHYQPIVAVKTGRMVGAEALVRWQHPERGLVAPAEFVPLAEETGLIVEIGAWVLGAACAAIREWQDAGLTPVRISVNLSSRQFREEKFEDSVKQILIDTGLDPHLLGLELTESIVMQQREQNVRLLRAFRSMGICISIDDFGTGYSSLGYLKHLPLDHLKIDHSFIRDITTDSDDAAIIRAIIAMAHRLNLKVTAEGVETEEQFALLRDEGCDAFQGFLVSRPIPAQEFAREFLGGRFL